MKAIPRIRKSEAVAWAGSQAALAERVGVSPSAISQWDEKVPESRVWQLIVLGCPVEQEQPGQQPEA